MFENEQQRIVLRRRIFDLKDDLIGVVHGAGNLDAELKRPLQDARNALFEAWTVLAMPLEEEDH